MTHPTPKECAKFIPVTGTATVVFDGRERYLIGERRGSHGAGTFCFPGGHLEYGETLQEGAARETKEECGLTVDVEPEILYVSQSPPQGLHFVEDELHYLTHFLLAIHAHGQAVRETEPEKFAQPRWVTWVDLRALEQEGHLFEPAAMFVRHLWGRATPYSRWQSLRHYR